MSLSITQLDDLDRIPVGDHGLLWRPIRRRLDIDAFGINAWTAAEVGQEVVEHHDETGSGSGKHEELYVVVHGRARFQLGEEEFDAPVGTCVFVSDRTVRRGAYAEEPGTTVVALGGKPGEAFEVSPWEHYFAAAEVIRVALERNPDNPPVLYNLACAESLAGDTEGAIEHLTQAVAGDARCAEWAKDDADFDPIRDDPRFASAIAGQADASGEGA